jgi:hypothetical protein
MKYSHTHGLGDFALIESHMSESERDSIEEILYGFFDKQSQALRDLIEACPRFDHVRHGYLSYPTERRKGYESTYANAGILHLKTFTGSSFLKYPLTEDLPELPERFDFVNVDTALNLKSHRRTRDIHPDEWPAILKRLEDRQTCGVLVGISTEGALPESTSLIDLRGKTTILQAVEILKRSSGYLGIDSCFSVLAAQLHQPKDLLIRTLNPNLQYRACEFFAPHQAVDFLTPEIGKPRHAVCYPVERLADGVIVESLRNVLVGNRNHGLGERFEVNRERAERMIQDGQAIPYTPLEDY